MPGIIALTEVGKIFVNGDILMSEYDLQKDILKKENLFKKYTTNWENHEENQEVGKFWSSFLEVLEDVLLPEWMSL